MKFEKLSDEKFQVFKKSEVVNPILISGGSVDTDSGPNHDRYQNTAGTTNPDNYQATADGKDFTQDGETTADTSDCPG